VDRNNVDTPVISVFKSQNVSPDKSDANPDGGQGFSIKRKVTLNSFNIDDILVPSVTNKMFKKDTPRDPKENT
jgi:hypothetical protein